MTTTTTGPGPVARWCAAPFSAVTWRATAQIELGMLLALLTGTVIWVLAVAGLTLAITLVLAAPVVAALFGCARTFSSWQRARIRSLAPAAAARRPWPDPPPPPATGGWWSRLWTQARSASIWRQIGYDLASRLLLPTVGLMVARGWCAALLGVTSAAFAWSLPGDVLGVP
ncbi:sensor domain-containing protein, partial [Nakamurella sp.]|uniref:sensor domain-containing protein n=1 Tax=Nakamurella sp. TaxID=1869182 RepID=UPI003B3AAA08